MNIYLFDYLNVLFCIRTTLTSRGSRPKSFWASHPIFHLIIARIGLGNELKLNIFSYNQGKNKKGKKGRMQRVDSRILNFSTTSASDRINIGDRQYPEFE